MGERASEKILLTSNISNPFRRRSLSSKTLAHLLQKRYQAHGCVWGLKEVRVEIRTHDPGAAGLAGAVLRILKGTKGLTNRLQCELAQGYAECLRRRGFGVVLHTTDAASVREQILELARKRFNAVKRKSGQTKARFKASSLATLLSKVSCTLQSNRLHPPISNSISRIQYLPLQ